MLSTLSNSNLSGRTDPGYPAKQAGFRPGRDYLLGQHAEWKPQQRFGGLLWSAFLVVLLLFATMLMTACSPADRAAVRNETGEAVQAVGTATEHAADEAGRRSERALEEAGAATQRAGEKTGDVAITAEVKAALLLDKRVAGMAIEVETDDGVVALRGTVSGKDEKRVAEQIARNVEGVRKVQNDLRT
ncbi:BON domain-containing protein [Chitinimonas arctica]|nr:BON domain-containing protein [Chitinimonas arctica]